MQLSMVPNSLEGKFRIPDEPFPDTLAVLQDFTRTKGVEVSANELEPLAIFVTSVQAAYRESYLKSDTKFRLRLPTSVGILNVGIEKGIISTLST